jgi:hypothetical protein
MTIHREGLKSPLKKAELYPIPRSNLFVFNGNVETLQNVIDKLHSPDRGNIKYPDLSESNQDLRDELSTSHENQVKSNEVPRDIMTRLSDATNTTKTLEAVVKKLQYESNGDSQDIFPIHVYEDPSEIPTRRLNGVVIPDDDAMTSREGKMTSRDSAITSRSLKEQREHDSLTRFLDDLQITTSYGGGTLLLQ